MELYKKNNQSQVKQNQKDNREKVFQSEKWNAFLIVKRGIKRLDYLGNGGCLFLTYHDVHAKF